MVIPIVIGVGVLAAFWFWWRRRLADLSTDDARSGDRTAVRLTSEALAGLPSPPWRLVREIPDDRLSGVDHVVIGPPGVVAIQTVLADRPVGAAGGGEDGADGPDDVDRLVVIAGARGAVDDLSSRGGADCRLLARVHWGRPDPDRPAAEEISTGVVAVEGQRLVDWLGSLGDGGLSASHVDLAWAAVTTGVGRPDPLA